MLSRFITILKHMWLDASDADRALPPAMLERLTKRVTSSENRHTGQIRICVEAALPMSYLWRLGKSCPLKTLIRQRAMMLFSKLMIWDTERNNGVLIYLQLAERSIEIVADRGLARVVPPADWQSMVARMRQNLQQSGYENGLTEALEEVSALLVLHFPATPGGTRTNELHDAPVIT